jgi:hypothetical protein
VRRLEILVLGGRPVGYLAALWYAAARGERMLSAPVYHAGEAQSILGRIRVRMSWRAMYVDIPLPRCRRMRRELSADLPLAAADMACCLNVHDSSMWMPRYLMLRLGGIVLSLRIRGGWCERSFVLSLLYLGRQRRSSDLGGEKYRPRCLPRSMWYSDRSFRHQMAKGTVRDDWRKLVSSTYEMLSSRIGWCCTSSIALA